MKKEINISEISQKLNISKSTVSKALNNKSGVSSETKQKVMDYARKAGYFYNHTDKTQINILIPARFKKHCNEFQNIFKEKNLNSKCGIYSTFQDYTRCLETLKKSECSILIVYPHSGTAPNTIKSLEKKLEIWFIGDTLNIENSFYFGENPKTSGIELANKFVCSHLTSPVFVLSENSHIAQTRTKFFFKTLADCQVHPSSVIDLTSKTVLSDALIARKLNESPAFDSIYCDGELSSLICGALKKLGKQNIPIFAYDETSSLSNAMRLAAANAKNYILHGDFPMCKYNIV